MESQIEEYKYALLSNNLEGALTANKNIIETLKEEKEISKIIQYQKEYYELKMSTNPQKTMIEIYNSTPENIEKAEFSFSIYLWGLFLLLFILAIYIAILAFKKNYIAKPIATTASTPIATY